MNTDKTLKDEAKTTKHIIKEYQDDEGNVWNELFVPLSIAEAREKEILEDIHLGYTEKELKQAIKQEREDNKEIFRIMCFNCFIAGKNDVVEKQFNEFFEVLWKDFINS